MCKQKMGYWISVILVCLLFLNGCRNDGTAQMESVETAEIVEETETTEEVETQTEISEEIQEEIFEEYDKAFRARMKEFEDEMDVFRRLFR